ncbi:MAG: hypothetical protein K8I82_08900, partial [Anaerolineae bacterium]|nr:hypothetical protein [Anaerolineae bacterium]
MERFKHKFFFYCSGQGIAEYALIMLFVGVVSIAVLSALGTSVKDVYSTVYEALSSVGTDSEDTPPDYPPPSDD